MAKEVPSAVMKRDSRHSVVAYVKEECLKNPHPKCLYDMLDTHLDPTKPIDDYDAITWCKWLMAGGPNYDIFAKKVREYDSSVMCGLVWTANFVAYRCRTCAISPCMSLCADCFQAGNHEGHDYNMFRSQAGGACDCGDVNVMNPAGFCPRHGPENQQAAPNPPAELLAVSQAMMPRIFMRLIFYLREISDPGLSTYTVNMEDAEQYLAFLHSLSDMGAAMRRIMTHALINTEQYKMLMKGEGNHTFYENSALKYENALQRLPYPEDFEGFNFDGKIKRRGSSTTEVDKKRVEAHKNMLEELVFWLVKCEFPQSMVTLLLGLLPDDTYKDAFTEAFVQHYSRISTVLASAKDRATVANRVVHISVQLFSNKRLATRMVTEHDLLSTVIASLTCMLHAILVPSTMTGGSLNRHLVVECERGVMKEHCYWPIVSDLINLLSHQAISHSFLAHPALPSAWMELLTSLQGMNLNHRELSQHVEYEPDTYYAAFSAELEISASPMWSLINHCNNQASKDYVITMVRATIIALEKWLTAIDFGMDAKPNHNQLTFHLPLHRYLAAFLMLGIQEHGLKLSSLLPAHSTLCQIMLHPLQIEVCLPQIYAGMWVRNGIQIKGQAMTYIQCHFCYSQADLDIYLLQVCAASLEPDHFMEIIMERFQLKKWLSFERNHKDQSGKADEVTPELAMLDGALGFLCSLFGMRTYLGISEDELVRFEMASLLCMNDRQHSQLSELMPERSGMSGVGRELFEPTLKTLADYKAPSFEAGVGLNQGSYTPKGFVWEREFDPVHVSQRAIYRKDFQAAMDRYSEHMRSTGKYKGKNAPWPPFRMPGKISPAYQTIYRLLNCSSMHALLFTVLYKALHEVPTMPDSIVYKTVHLLDLCLQFAPKTFPSVTPSVSSLVKDGNLRSWFHTTDVKANACEVIHRVELLSKRSSVAGEYDLSSGSLEEMFNMQPSIVASFGGPITAAQTGQIPSLSMVSMPSASGSLSYTMATSTQTHTTSPDVVKPKYQSRGVSTHSSPSTHEKVLGESIISTLIKLHDKMATPGVLFKPLSSQDSPSEMLVGDGAFYIARFLNRLNSSSTTASRYIHSTCQALHVQVKGDKKQDPDKSDSKRKKAFNRQQKLMAQFASKQKAFMAQAQDGRAESLGDDDELDSVDGKRTSSVPSGKQYDCVICNQSAPSKMSRPFGLVIFLQSTSVLGHRKHTDNTESITASPSQEHMASTRCGGISRRHYKQLLTHFDEASCHMSVNIGWEGGVFVTTCGHYLHLDCQRSYIDTLRNQPQTETISINQGEFYCPMCRQLSNAVLPIVPEEQSMSLAKPVAFDPISMVNDLAEMMIYHPTSFSLHEVMLVMRHTMDAIYGISYDVFRSLTPHDSSNKKVLFIYSIARNNLEMEVLLRGGNLLQPLPAAASKKMCILPLLHLLGLQSKAVLASPDTHTQLWSHITGVPLKKDSSSSLSLYTQQVPLVLKDLVAQLVQILLMLPLTIDIKQYLFVVEKLYCVIYMQALVTFSCRFTQEEREAWRKKGDMAPVGSLEKWLSFVIRQLCQSPLYEEVDAGNILPAICQSVWSPHSVEAGVQEFCLPFLRVATLLRLYIFGPDLPSNQAQSEFEMLATYLNLIPAMVMRSASAAEITGSACLQWAIPDPTVLVKAWCSDINNFAKVKASECKSLLNIDNNWVSPHLLSLPERYYEIFTLYRHKTCTRCQRIPKDPAICLICGAFLCFRENCCVNESTNVFECVEHSILCGAGTGIYLLVNSSIIVVLRGPRATLWGSLYLDQHGEEDRDLKRGKPLFLSPERLQLLENQWVTHTFEQCCKRWIWHRDRL